MHIPESLMDSVSWLAFHFDQLLPYIPTYIHLLVSAVIPIYAGSHASLSRPSSADKPSKRKSREADDDVDDEDEPIQRMEGLSPSDALLFPVMAGITLTSLYFIIKWLEDPALLNKILNWYFAGFSILSVGRLVSDGLDVLHSLIFPHDYIDSGRLYHVDPRKRLALPVSDDDKHARTSPLPGPFSRLPLPQLIKNMFWFLHIVPNQKLSFKLLVRNLLRADFKLGIHGLEGIAVGLLTVFYHNFVDKPWFLTNLFGFGFAYGALQLLSPTTFATGFLLLSLLFFYDIYFVFYTPMMVGVAKSLDVPVKLLFPSPPRPGDDPSRPSLSMLGLGDIVLPGIMAGLALRFDLYLFYLYKQSTQKQSESKEKSEDSKQPGSDKDYDIIKAPYKSVAEGWGDRLWTSRWVAYFFWPVARRTSAIQYTPRGVFPKPYFTASIVGYLLGMLSTLAAMQISNHPQPALLYLVPGVLGSLLVTGFFRGELRVMWAFSDAAEDEQQKKDEDKKVKDSKDSSDSTGNSEAKDKTNASQKAASGRESGRSVIDKLGDRLEKQLESYEDKADPQDRTLFEFSIALPPLLQPAEGKSASTKQDSPRWKEGSPSDAPGQSDPKPDQGHSDKRIRLE